MYFSRRLFVTGFPGAVTHGELSTKFEEYGRIVGTQLYLSRSSHDQPYAFIDFNSSSEATLARSKMHNSQIRGFNLEVHFDTKIPRQFHNLLDEQYSDYGSESPGYSVSPQYCSAALTDEDSKDSRRSSEYSHQESPVGPEFKDHDAPSHNQNKRGEYSDRPSRGANQYHNSEPPRRDNTPRGIPHRRRSPPRGRPSDRRMPMSRDHRRQPSRRPYHPYDQGSRAHRPPPRRPERREHGYRRDDEYYRGGYVDLDAPEQDERSPPHYSEWVDHGSRQPSPGHGDEREYRERPSSRDRSRTRSPSNSSGKWHGSEASVRSSSYGADTPQSSADPRSSNSRFNEDALFEGP
ncbi:hypothetical protein GGI26_002502 [Coemansia sp. RSA 1358]|uniref:RRM domain-containing protein n=1 Tax=Coemansia umbellata TaxID=1424467 RepID=A0ABQ8PP16_9FUNG|nr:hypothetical protein EDC05_002629 [Coemansia umbellata]KAJ2623275.1 hypothetical protein GGI26_002502 [Coemansia sp. RSA 1358]